MVLLYALILLSIIAACHGVRVTVTLLFANRADSVAMTTKTQWNTCRRRPCIRFVNDLSKGGLIKNVKPGNTAISCRIQKIAFMIKLKLLIAANRRSELRGFGLWLRAINSPMNGTEDADTGHLTSCRC